jgi:hypothetical protein
MHGYLSGKHRLSCFGGPCCGEEHYVALTSAPLVLRKTWVFGEGEKRWTFTVAERYVVTRIHVGDQRRLVLKWTPGQ